VVAADEVAAGRDELDRGDVVAREPVPACEVADPSSEGVPDDADVRRRPGERRQPVLRGAGVTSRHRRPAPTRAVLAAGIDPDPGERRRAHEDAAREVAEGRRGVPVPWTAMRRPASRAATTTHATSAASAGNATAAGR
jgi:hypothetical protein